MYLPYLRGKQFELEALLELPSSICKNVLPILEPVNSSDRLKLFSRITNKSVPLILIMNPYHPQGNPLTTDMVQNIIDAQMSTHSSLVLGFIVDQRFTIANLNSFLRANTNREKALIFRHSPLPTDLTSIRDSLITYSVEYMIFDDRKTNTPTRAMFSTHPKRILLIDGFQKQERNADYPAMSIFDSNYSKYITDGWFGFGDYATIGDIYQDGGGQVFVITLHVTAQAGRDLYIHHFSSTISSKIKGLSAIKFAQANKLLLNSPHVISFTTSGIALYRSWDARSHNPQLGAAKKASIMHHIEFMSSLI